MAVCTTIYSSSIPCQSLLLSNSQVMSLDSLYHWDSFVNCEQEIDYITNGQPIAVNNTIAVNNKHTGSKMYVKNSYKTTIHSI